MRYITEEEDAQNNWANRKTRVVQSIRENDFDVFGLQECSPDIKSYLSSELADTYSIRYFDPKSASGTGNHESMGLAYKSAKYTLSNWHYFWLSDTPSTMTLNNEMIGTAKLNSDGTEAVITADNTVGDITQVASKIRGLA